MNILLFGSNGQVGHELKQLLPSLGNVFSFNRQQADFEDLNCLDKIIDSICPDIIVNAAAYTAVDKAEKESNKAKVINTDAVALLANRCKALNAKLIHYSTDYVFDGKKTGVYVEDDLCNPLNVYGKTKREGELAIEKSGCDYLIFRTSWVYSTRNQNFMKTMINLFQDKEVLHIIDDQVGTPTSASLIANTTVKILSFLLNSQSSNNQYQGIYALVPIGETTWYDYAQFIWKRLKQHGMDELLNLKQITPVKTEMYPTIAVRPLNSRMSTKKLQDTFAINLPHWKKEAEQHITKIAGELLNGS